MTTAEENHRGPAWARRPAMSKNEFRMLLEAATSDLRLEIEFAGTTALRPKEQFWLTWGDVSLARRTLTVSQNRFLAPYRFVPLSSTMAEKLRLKKENVDSSNDEMVFPKRPMPGRQPQIIPGDFRDLMKRLVAVGPGSEGLANRTWHDFRRFACMSWQEAELPNWAQYAGVDDFPWEIVWKRPHFPTSVDFDIIDQIASS